MKKVAFILTSYPLGVSTMVISAAKEFAQRGHLVDIFIDEREFNYSPISFHEKEINVVIVDRKSSIPPPGDTGNGYGKRSPVINRLESVRNRLAWIKHFLFYLVGSIFLSNENQIYAMVRLFKPSYFSFLKLVKDRIDESYECLIGIEILGLFAARCCKTSPSQKIVYFNMELFQFSKDRSRTKFTRYILERSALLGGVDLIMIQNEARRQTFLTVNPFIDPSKVLILPVAAIGNRYEKKSHFFRELFGIRHDKKLILYAGNIVDWAMCLEIVKSAAKWSNDFALVLHTYTENPSNPDYFSEIKENLIEGKSFLSMKALNYSELDEALSSADIALLFYQGSDENFTEIGFSSNKLAQYVKVGLPIISNDLPAFKEILENNKCGVCVPDAGNINDAAAKILQSYDEYRQNAFNLYDHKFNFSSYFEDFYNKLDLQN
jgi:glycosyltransferase involved in cell wall biosynthesis